MSNHLFLRLSLLAVFLGLTIFSPLKADIIHIVYTSDMHYGITRTFRGHDNVPSNKVNQEMLRQINRIIDLKLPSNGVGAGEIVGCVEAIINTGDIVNRMQKDAQSSAKSWAQFNQDWKKVLNLKNKKGEQTPTFLSIGNHEASNAIGLYKLVQDCDHSPIVDIYNKELAPEKKLTYEEFDYATHKINYSAEICGIRLLFVHLWPDSKQREWIKSEIATFDKDQPILLFTHDAPSVLAQHFINPNGDGGINEHDRFENILQDVCSVTSIKQKPVAEELALSKFLRNTPSIKAYLHGDYNYSEFYTWKDPNGVEVIPTFRVDSPMKGLYSQTDESLLSFMLLSIDTDNHTMTAREVLWNQGDDANPPIVWGNSRTITLK